MSLTPKNAMILEGACAYIEGAAVMGCADPELLKMIVYLLRRVGEGDIGMIKSATENLVGEVDRMVWKFKGNRPVWDLSVATVHLKEEPKAEVVKVAPVVTKVENLEVKAKEPAKIATTVTPLTMKAEPAAVKKEEPKTWGSTFMSFLGGSLDDQVMPNLLDAKSVSTSSLPLGAVTEVTSKDVTKKAPTVKSEVPTDIIKSDPSVKKLTVDDIVKPTTTMSFPEYKDATDIKKDIPKKVKDASLVKKEYDYDDAYYDTPYHSKKKSYAKKETKYSKKSEDAIYAQKKELTKPSPVHVQEKQIEDQRNVRPAMPDTRNAQHTRVFEVYKPPTMTGSTRWCNDCSANHVYSCDCANCAVFKCKSKCLKK